MEDTISLVVLGMLAAKIIEFLKYLHGKDWNAAFTLVSVWVAGVIVVLLGANANAFEGAIVPGMVEPLGSLNFWSLLLIGLTFTSLISFAYDFKKALDSGDSAKQPPLTSLK